MIMRGDATPAQIGAFFMGLAVKGETVEEITGAALAMREFATPVKSSRRPLLDTCGTGGDHRSTVNVSTAAALVVAGAGVAVAKHGNRSVTSRCGSADVLEALGVHLELTAEQMGECLDEVGIAFLFAPMLHGAMKHAAGPRRELRLRTVMNLLGPLTNPAGAERQLLGVYDAGRAAQLAGVLRALGTERAWVVHGLEGLDEISVSGPSVAFDVRAERPAPARRRLQPEDAGLPRHPAEALRGGDAADNARWLEALLAGERRDASRDMVLLNAGAALVVAGRARGWKEGVRRAAESIDSGAARDVLARLVTTSKRLASAP